MGTILRFITAALVAGIFTFSSSVAQGVAARGASASEAEKSQTVKTQAQERAEADIQIRRLKSLIVTKRNATEAEYDKLEKLQKVLRGEN